MRKTVSKSAPHNGFRQSLKSGFFKNTSKQVFFPNSCFVDNFLRILFFSTQAPQKKEGKTVAVYFLQMQIITYNDYKTKNDFFKVR